MVFTLVPWPASVTEGDGRMPLRRAAAVHGDPRLARIVIDGIARRTGIHLAVGDPDATAADGDVVLRLDAVSANPEAYRLTVDAVAEVTAGTVAGLFYGVQTLLQLLETAPDGTPGWPRVRIDDAPRFGYRGLMLDVVRHFFPVDELKTHIDRAAALKLNHLHLHLTDDQGWRLEIVSWPHLTARASSGEAGEGPGGFYSQDDYREIVRYAADRHITVVPEIDLPGHTHAVGVAYPELVEPPVMNDALLAQAAQLGQPLPEHGQPYTGWGVGHSSVRIHDERAEQFVRDVLTEVAALTPGPYLHIGGDESLGTAPADFAAFLARTSRLVRELGKIPVAWHEAGAVEDLVPGTVGQYWGSTTPHPPHAEHAAGFVAGGGAVILSPSDAAYLDISYSDDFPLGLTWPGAVDVARSAGWEPGALLPVPASAILGVEAALWTETVATRHDAEQLMYPRLAVQSELAWTAPDADERSWASLRQRLGALGPLWQSEGIAFHPAPEIPWSTR